MSMLQASIQFIEFPDFIITWVQMKDIVMQGCSYMHVMLKYLCQISVWKSFSFFSYALLCMYCQLNYPAVNSLDCDISVRLLFVLTFVHYLTSLSAFALQWLVKRKFNQALPTSVPVTTRYMANTP